MELSFQSHNIFVTYIVTNDYFNSNAYFIVFYSVCITLFILSSIRFAFYKQHNEERC